jgi:hypothetical protein
MWRAMVPSSSQEVAVLIPLLITLPIILTTIVIHAAAVQATVQFIQHEYHRKHAGVHFWKDVAIATCVILLTLFAHGLSVTIWAAAYDVSGQFADFSAALYNSAMCYTGLGSGAVSASWKFLEPLETVNGLTMFGVSTAMIFAVIQQLLETKSARKQASHPDKR